MMKFIRLLIAIMFASGGLSQAAESNSISDDEETDIRFECIQDAITDGLEDQQRTAVRQRPSDKKS